jgi:uncharacterized protein (TIGR03083 family)
VPGPAPLTAPPNEPPDDLAALFAIERASLLDWMGGLREADWLRPTPCPGWTVLDLCRHLLGDDFSALSWHRDGHRETIPPPDVDEAGFVEWLDGLQRDWDVAARRISPRLAIELLRWTGTLVVETFARADPSARTAHVSWAGPDPVPVWLDQVRELSEHWLHRQQLRMALGQHPDLDERRLGVILDGFRWAYPYRLRSIAVRPGDTVVIEIGGGLLERAWTLVAVDPAGWGFAAPSTHHASAVARARLRVSVDEAWRLLSNNLGVAAQAELDVTGDPPVVEVLLRTRAIVGTPNTG